ncbi:hypothetical protein EJ08DRAFT_698987 [Tothia fuscella]|uniref:Uncharacterized protein n=1 Tax=Tothia fuscella TaxID=1048955 RepID=A0A9P4NNI6_9PEZI|nr:hypothetical protein EJ08DRAFT_698987 [Tothia fuscella]
MSKPNTSKITTTTTPTKTSNMSLPPTTTTTTTTENSNVHWQSIFEACNKFKAGNLAESALGFEDILTHSTGLRFIWEVECRRYLTTMIFPELEEWDKVKAHLLPYSACVDRCLYELGKEHVITKRNVLAREMGMASMSDEFKDTFLWQVVDRIVNSKACRARLRVLRQLDFVHYLRTKGGSNFLIHEKSDLVASSQYGFWTRRAFVALGEKRAPSTPNEFSKYQWMVQNDVELE